MICDGFNKNTPPRTTKWPSSCGKRSKKGEGEGAAPVGNKITTKRPILPRWAPKNEKCMNSKYPFVGFVGTTLVFNTSFNTFF